MGLPGSRVRLTEAKGLKDLTGVQSVMILG